MIASNTSSTMISTMPSHDGMHQPQSRLLQLPGELRNHILKYVVTQPDPIDLWGLHAAFDIDVRVMYVCKQLRDEARIFLYRDNILEVGIDTKGTVTSLHFSRHHMLCRYRAEEAVKEVESLYLARFSHFQFRFADAKQFGALHPTVNPVKHHFDGKHVKVILPLPKDPKSTISNQLPRVSLYPRINSPVTCFSLMRCASFSIASPVPDYDLTQHEKLIELVTSNKPVLDMTREYAEAERSARNVVKMLVPSEYYLEYERLADQVFTRLAAMCESANLSDQDSFLVEQEMFQRSYKEVEDVQWKV